jgi:adenylate cyclase
MQANRTATVLFAEPSSDAKRSEASKKAVAAAITNVAESTGGRVVKTIGGKLMVVFASPDAAASAASKIQAKIDVLPAVGGIKLGVHIGFHSGPALRAAGTAGVADDTVKLALQLVEQAQDGQTVTSQMTAEQLNPAFRGFSRPLRSVRERSAQVALCELTSWHQKGVRPQGWAAMAVLRLTCGEQLAVCSREKATIVLGRGEDCDLLVDSKAGSREHCSIEYCRGDFILRDHSSNGTYISVADRAEIAVHNEKLPLPEHGVISIGEPRSRSSSDLIEFWYALVT